MKAATGAVLKQIAAGKVQPLYLVRGDLVLAEPAAQRLATALAEKVGCEVETYRHPQLGELLADLRTFSLFAAAKVALAVDTAIFADKSAAASLIDQAGDAPPVSPDPDAAMELNKQQRIGASRLLQALRIFGLDAAKSTPAKLIGSLPKWALQGGRAYRKGHPRGRPAGQIKTLKDDLTTLLKTALAAGLQGVAEGDLAELSEVVSKGLPEGHALVLAEHSAAADHPLVKALTSAGAAVDLGCVEAGWGGKWQGLDALVTELSRETSAGIARDALSELADRTLRKQGDWGKDVDGGSTTRFAAEYRKLAMLAKGGKISRRLVVEIVKDRGQEDVWKILDAVGAGRGDEAISRYRRLLAASGDAVGERMRFFGLLANFCRHIVAVAGMAKLERVPPGVRAFKLFESRWASVLQGEVPGVGHNPLARLKPFRLHKAYLAASSFDRSALARLPWWVLETEMQIKGESSEPDVAMARLMARLAACCA